MAVTEVDIEPASLDRFEPLVGPERTRELTEAGDAARVLLAGRTVWNVNSTATGGGVAEMLTPLLAYSRGAGIDARWLVIGGDADFFRLTKRLHNGFHGSPGDGGPFGEEERDHYAAIAAANAEGLRERVRPGDVVILHDPQTAGLVGAMKDAGAVTVWRSHIGSDTVDERTTRSWAFLRPFLGGADAYVFSRPAYVPEWLTERVHVIAPSVDPFSPKNQDLAPATVLSILAHIGVVAGEDGSDLSFTRVDGSTGRVERRAAIIREGPPPSPGSPLVVQVSRWDRLKDMAGVMEGFARGVAPGSDAHLALVGPDVSGVSDDPEGAEVLAECERAWRALPDDVRARVQLVSLPMDDVEENAAMVNAIQRHASVVCQKSLAEGFGLTVAEAMWKARPVVASAIGGIQDQIVDGRHGLLVGDPADLDEFADAVARLVADHALAKELGQAARRRAIELFLGSRHLLQYGTLFAELL